MTTTDGGSGSTTLDEDELDTGGSSEELDVLIGSLDELLSSEVSEVSVVSDVSETGSEVSADVLLSSLFTFSELSVSLELSEATDDSEVSGTCVSSDDTSETCEVCKVSEISGGGGSTVTEDGGSPLLLTCG